MADSKKKTRSSASKKRNSKKGAKDNVSSSDASKSKRSRLYEEIVSIIVIALGLFLIFAFFISAAGEFGEAVSWFFKGCFGALALALPFYLILYGMLLFAKKTALKGARSAILLIVIFLMLTILNSERFIEPSTMSFSLNILKDFFDSGVLLESGGIFGMTIGLFLVNVIGSVGLYILCIVITVIALLLLINSPVSSFYDKFSGKIKERRDKKAERKAEQEALKAEEEASEAEDTETGRTSKSGSIDIPASTESENKKSPPSSPSFLKDYPKKDSKMTENQIRIIDYVNDDDIIGDETVKNEAVDEPVGEKSHVVDEISNKEAGAAMLTNEELNSKKVSRKYKLPPVDLLIQGVGQKEGDSEVQLQERANKLEKTLRDFNVGAKISQVTKGPAVTRYEIQPNTGVKVSSIVRLADDIALNLEAKSIRIEAPIPGKAAVGIEVENDRINLVTLRDIISSRDFKNSKSKISFAVGKDISGRNIIGDLKTMPHLLIAGATGSGKSVCINGIIMSILYKARPDEVKLVLIDPKVVELRNYDGIPHLLIPVVTEPGKAAASLNWAVAEMNDRYKKFAEAGVKELESYNELMRMEDNKENVLPQIVIIIDELADLMMVSPAKVEEAICRIAQMARAAGMHLIVATQRPSVDVITGVIKANIPSRIAFAVSSQFDSKTILDMVGAEHLVGKGDMLYNPVGFPKPIRVQGSYVTDKEVRDVISFVKDQGMAAEYSDEVIEQIESDKPNTQKGEGDDELLADAIETVILAKQASTSMLQRRFRIGYNRAARLMDMLEEKGIIGPPDGSRPRSVLVTEEEYNGSKTEDE